MNATVLARAIAAQSAQELRLTLRRGESVLVTLILPVILLIFFASARVLPRGGHALGFLVPGTLALAVIGTSLVSLGIATAYERYYRVLKWYGATPFPRWALITAKISAVVLLECVEVAVLLAVAVIFLGWRPGGSLPLGLLFLLAGTIAFAGLGLTLAGTLRAEATLAVANALFVFFLLLGGLFVPLDHLPVWLAPVARLLPADALAESVRQALRRGPGVAPSNVLVLGAWTVLLPGLAARLFRWE
jgi:ABC-2 type transport system permease protein